MVALFDARPGRLELAEPLIEAATAVMGVGPAYQALLAEAQVDAAVRHGLPAPLAAELVVQTMMGTAALLDAARVRHAAPCGARSTSPGGSTARGLDALEAGGVRSAFQQAIDAVIFGGRR